MIAANELTIRGAVANLWYRWRDYTEAVIVGAAGTGKSMGVGWWLDDIAETFPGCRILVVRKTRASLTESWMQTFQKAMWMAFPDGEKAYLFDGPTDRHRASYNYKNGSRIVLGGMDNPTRLFSTEFDIIYVNECNELSLEEWESLHRALRNNRTPSHLLLGDCNPDSKTHWLYKRLKAGTTAWLKSFHGDNPFLDDEEGQRYLHTLRYKLSGVRYRRLFEGEWCTAEGAVWPEWDEEKHVIDARLEESPLGWFLHIKQEGPWTQEETGKNVPVKLERFVGGQDWGYTNPGTQQVWGMDKEGRLYLIPRGEHFYSKRGIDWWADVAHENYRRFHLSPIVCDGSRNDYVDAFNDRLGSPRSREAARIAIEADKAVESGIEHVRDRLIGWEDGWPRLFVCRDSLAHAPDPELSGETGLLTSFYRPHRLTEEIAGYVYDDVDPDDPDPNRDRPRKKNDHGCDAMRYVCTWAWRRKPEIKEKKDYRPGTPGALFKSHRGSRPPRW